MGHHIHEADDFEDLSLQRNILSFIGNGFDIQASGDHGPRARTNYVEFHAFLKRRHFDPENLLLQKMESLRDRGAKNWSDLEYAVGKLLINQEASAGQILSALNDVQSQFAEFLDFAVPTSLLSEIGQDSSDRELAVGSLAGFLGDLDDDDYRDLQFTQHLDNFQLFNFQFFNLNYTSLFDNFIHLDSKQFDPLPRKTVDRNFDFQGNPKHVSNATIRPGDTFSSYLLTNIDHPHGRQAIPSSLLIGIDQVDTAAGRQDPALRLAKPFWGQNRRKYKHYFDDTELYIIFGCSLGESDRWWWQQIANHIGRQHHRSSCKLPGCSGTEVCTFIPEVVIYWWQEGADGVDKSTVCDTFFSAAGQPDLRSQFGRHVKVVRYSHDSPRAWLNTAVK